MGCRLLCDAVERRTARLDAEGRRWQRAAFSFGPRLYCGAPLHPRAFATTPVKWLGGVCVRRLIYYLLGQVSMGDGSRFWDRDRDQEYELVALLWDRDWLLDRD